MLRTKLVVGLLLAAAGAAAADVVSDVAPWAGSVDTSQVTATADQAKRAVGLACSPSANATQCGTSTLAVKSSSSGSPQKSKCADGSDVSASGYAVYTGIGVTVSASSCGVSTTASGTLATSVPVAQSTRQGVFVTYTTSMKIAGPELWSSLPVDPWRVGPPAP